MANSKETKKTICMGCHCECGVLVDVEGGKVTKILGDPDFPQNEGTLCPRGPAYVQFLNHPDRLVHPLERGKDGKWNQISWDEALDKIVAKFQQLVKQHGPKALAFVFCDGDRDNLVFNVDWLTALGSPNLVGTDAQYCIRPNWIGDSLTFGQALTWEKGPDYRNSKCILAWGGNPLQTHLGSKGQEILQGLDRGAKLIVVDPIFSNLAARADLWLQVRPATDAALALGMLNVIINEQLYDKEFVAKWTVGFDQLRERVQQFPPEKAAQITWVPKEKIVAAARMFATSKPASLHHRMGVTMHTNGLQTVRAIDMLIAICGNLDVKGGNVLPFPAPNSAVKSSYGEFPRVYLKRLPEEVRDQRFGTKEYPVGYKLENSWQDSHPVFAMDSTRKEGGIKAMYVVNDPVMGMQNSKEIVRDLSSLDFLVVVDHWLTPTASYANIVLPAAAWPERDLVHELHYLNFVGVAPKVVEPAGECWDERDISLELSKRMGLKNFFAIKSVEEWNDLRLSRLGLTFQQFYKKHGTFLTFPFETEKFKRFKKFPGTESGKVELYSAKLKKYGYDPLPNYVEPPESPISTPELAKEYPFILVSGVRKVAYFHSYGRQIPWLRELVPDPVIEINPEAAAPLGIKDGDWVWVETPKIKGEKVKLRVKLSLAVHEKVIRADSHWWFPERKNDPHRGCFESNINVVTYKDPPYDDVLGCPLIRGSLCRVQKVEA